MEKVVRREFLLFKSHIFMEYQSVLRIRIECLKLPCAPVTSRVFKLSRVFLARIGS
jgi:hypothetical protein